jgi:pimeloyl-ACP methyl ester carboxylesterase
MAFVDAVLKKSENVGVVCYDSVGFGLTERPRTDLMKFTKVFNAKCLKAMAKKYASDGDTNNYTKKKKKKKVVYVGHSLGAIAATLTTTLEDGDDDDAKPSALILIAPAFLVKQEKQKKTKKKDDNTFDGEEGEKSDERRRKEKAAPKKKVISPDDEFYDEELFNRVVLSSLKAAWGCVASLLFNIVAKPLLYVILRTIVRSKQFWRNGLSKVVAKSKASLVDDSWIDGYRRPRVVQNWDLGMINFVSASLNDLGTDLKAMFRRHMRIYADKPTEYDLSMNPMDALRKSAWENNVPILIVHGAEDAIVPASNSVNIRNRLLTAPPNARPDDDVNDDEIPETSKKVSQNSPPPPPLQNPSPPFVRFVAMERVGHCPHEEDPETFATVALTFLKDAGCLA